MIAAPVLMRVGGVLTLITHDETVNTICLFLRTQRTGRGRPARWPDDSTATGLSEGFSPRPLVFSLGTTRGHDGGDAVVFDEQGRARSHR
jgi:hypothetical protein